MRTLIAGTIILLTTAVLAAGQGQDVTPVHIIVEWSSRTPLISPSAGPASAGAFNPAAVRHGGRTILLYREQDTAGTSRIGYASSADGIHFTTSDQPVLKPETDYEKDGGVEDPRLLKIADLYYMTYTGYNRKDAQLCLATSKDLIHWERKGIMLPAYKGNWNTGWTKSGAIVPHRINGRWWMYYLGTAPDKRDYMGLASSPDLLHWSDASAQPVLPRRAGAFDSRVMEPGPPPLITDAGILLIYKMKFNTEKGIYETSLFLKQGYYDYCYVSIDATSNKRIPIFNFTEGNYWESENEYTILVYYRPLAGRADELVGYTRVNSLTGR